MQRRRLRKKLSRKSGIWFNFKSRNQKSRNLGGMKIPRGYQKELEEMWETEKYKKLPPLS